MSVLTTIAGVPLFSTVQEATSWAVINNCSGYHVHNFQGQTGFMGCANHLQASGMPLNSNAPSSPQTNSTVNTGSGFSTSGSGY